jgi:hypothetical protein
MQYLGYFYIFVPLIFLVLIALRRHPSALQWLVINAPFALGIIFLWATARWEIPSAYLRPVFPVLLIVALVFGFRRIGEPGTRPGKLATIWNYTISSVMLVMFLGMTVIAFRGYPTPPNTVDLKPPLRNGKFVILHGGTTSLINGHSKVRPQNFAIDIVQLGSWGRRAKSFTGGSNLDDYYVFGAPVYAPCDGEVLAAETSLEDLTPPAMDRKNPAGNHVLIGCGDIEVLLAHLQKASVNVVKGDAVRSDSIVGRVGNTGNTSEPHLHMHVERGGNVETILNGEAVPFTIDDQFLVRGDVFGNCKGGCKTQD